MKRYNIDTWCDCWNDEFSIGNGMNAKEDSEGEWIRYEDYKAEREEMLKLLIEINKMAQISDDRFSQYSDTIHAITKQIIEKVTGKSIEEVLK